jgi:hypothetical protein
MLSTYMANKESKALQHITKKKIPLLFLHKSLIFLTPFLILSFCFAWEIRSNPSQWWLTPDSSKMSFWFGTNPFIFKEQIIVLNALQYQLPLNSSFVKDRITDQINVFLWKHLKCPLSGTFSQDIPSDSKLLKQFITTWH